MAASLSFSPAVPCTAVVIVVVLVVVVLLATLLLGQLGPRAHARRCSLEAFNHPLVVGAVAVPLAACVGRAVMRLRLRLPPTAAERETREEWERRNWEADATVAHHCRHSSHPRCSGAWANNRITCTWGRLPNGK